MFMNSYSFAKLDIYTYRFSLKLIIHYYNIYNIKLYQYENKKTILM